jgi:hypothetical protein
MINTPKKLLYEKAINGNWEDFIVNPTLFAIKLEKKFKKSGYYSKNETFKLNDKLQLFLDKNIKKDSPLKIMAVYRAFLAVLLTKMDMIDDSFGIIGGQYNEVFEFYINIERKELKMHPETFLTDVLDLIIWEDYGMIDIYKTDFFQTLSEDEKILTESILRDKIETLWELELNDQAEEALSTLTTLYVQHKMFDKFVPLAKELGTRHWQRITTLADTAEENEKHDLAIQVLKTCLAEKKSYHYDFLREKYEKLLSNNS